MTRFDPTSRPDSFELEAAARRHRSDGYGQAVDAAIAWIESRLNSAREFGRITTSAPLHAPRLTSR